MLLTLADLQSLLPGQDETWGVVTLPHPCYPDRVLRQVVIGLEAWGRNYHHNERVSAEERRSSREAGAFVDLGHHRGAPGIEAYLLTGSGSAWRVIDARGDHPDRDGRRLSTAFSAVVDWTLHRGAGSQSFLQIASVYVSDLLRMDDTNPAWAAGLAAARDRRHARLTAERARESA